MKRPGLRELWRERVKAFRTSGLNGVAWCAQEGVSRDQLYYWLKKFENEPTPDNAPAADPNGWLPVTIDVAENPGQAQPLTVRIGHAVIEVQSGFDQNLFADVAKALVALC